MKVEVQSEGMEVKQTLALDILPFEPKSGDAVEEGFRLLFADDMKAAGVFVDFNQYTKQMKDDLHISAFHLANVKKRVVSNAAREGRTVDQLADLWNQVAKDYQSCSIATGYIESLRQLNVMWNSVEYAYCVYLYLRFVKGLDLDQIKDGFKFAIDNNLIDELDVKYYKRFAECIDYWVKSDAEKKVAELIKAFHKAAN